MSKEKRGRNKGGDRMRRGGEEGWEGEREEGRREKGKNGGRKREGREGGRGSLRSQGQEARFVPDCFCDHSTGVPLFLRGSPWAS